MDTDYLPPSLYETFGGQQFQSPQCFVDTDFGPPWAPCPSLPPPTGPTSPLGPLVDPFPGWGSPFVDPTGAPNSGSGTMVCKSCRSNVPENLCTGGGEKPTACACPDDPPISINRGCVDDCRDCGYENPAQGPGWPSPGTSPPSGSPSINAPANMGGGCFEPCPCKQMPPAPNGDPVYGPNTKPAPPPVGPGGFPQYWNDPGAKVCVCDDPSNPIGEGCCRNICGSCIPAPSKLPGPSPCAKVIQNGLCSGRGWVSNNGSYDPVPQGCVHPSGTCSGLVGCSCRKCQCNGGVNTCGQSGSGDNCEMYYEYGCGGKCGASNAMQSCPDHCEGINNYPPGVGFGDCCGPMSESAPSCVVLEVRGISSCVEGDCCPPPGPQAPPCPPCTDRGWTDCEIVNAQGGPRGSGPGPIPGPGPAPVPGGAGQGGGNPMQPLTGGRDGEKGFGPEMLSIDPTNTFGYDSTRLSQNDNTVGIDRTTVNEVRYVKIPTGKNTYENSYVRCGDGGPDDPCVKYEPATD